MRDAELRDVPSVADLYEDVVAGDEDDDGFRERQRRADGDEGKAERRRAHGEVCRRDVPADGDEEGGDDAVLEDPVGRGLGAAHVEADGQADEEREGPERRGEHDEREVVGRLERVVLGVEGAVRVVGAAAAEEGRDEEDDGDDFSHDRGEVVLGKNNSADGELIEEFKWIK